MIRGRVTDAGGAPLASVRVSAARPGASFTRVAETYTAADGTYALGALAPGAYVVAFQPADDHVAQDSGGATTIRDAASVTVGAGADTTGVDTALAAGAVLKGHVSDEAGGGALRWAEVTATPSVPDELLELFATRDADDHGDYVIQGLRPGTYALRFASPFDRDMAPEDGPAVTVAAGETKIINNDLHALVGADPEPGHAAGTVTGPDGTPLAGARVTPVTATNYARDTVLTDAAGRFTTADLAAGTYRLRVAAPGLTTTYFPASPSLGASQPVTVQAGQTAAGNAIAMVAAGAPPGDGSSGGGSPGGDPSGGGPPSGGAPPPTSAPLAPVAPAPTLAASFPIARRAALAPPAVTGRARVLSGTLTPRAGRIAVRLACPGAVACRGTLRVVERTRRVTVASGSFAVPAGRQATVRPKLTARGRALTRKRHVAVAVVLPGARTACATLVG
jgi:protocatechuate 3,4-dioxygenase beta subunit